MVVRFIKLMTVRESAGGRGGVREREKGSEGEGEGKKGGKEVREWEGGRERGA